MSDAIRIDLQGRRPDLTVQRDRPAYEYLQYQHLGALIGLRRRIDKRVGTSLARLRSLLDSEHAAGRLTRQAKTRLSREIDKVTVIADDADNRLQTLVDQLATESFLKLDVTVSKHLAMPDAQPLLIGLSAKWSLRTDRAQDCVSQGSKLVTLRRGRMPHFALVTIEPRPAMLALVADGSGSVDVVYHLALPELIAAVNTVSARRARADWSPLVTLNRLLAQGRLLDYDDLVGALDEIAA